MPALNLDLLLTFPVTSLENHVREQGVIPLEPIQEPGPSEKQNG